MLYNFVADSFHKKET